MDWDHFFLKRDNWQREAFDQIKKSLISAKDNRFIQYDYSKENHLVMIYGKSQTGKTTLILNMIGINEEYFKEVYDTLRAGIPHGNSSTSTAIIYAKSNNHQYGFSLSKINSVVDKEIEYCNSAEMISKLENMRKMVEANRANTEDILYIYIPCHYFTDDAIKYDISVMDMPGVESKNQKEKRHVENLMTRYMPISSVCIIVCQSNDIQSLESLELPISIDWKRMSHRFIIAITKAYTNGNTKNDYFEKEQAKRGQSFFEYVTLSYDNEIKNILGKNNQIEVFPIDVGESLIMLCKDYPKEQLEIQKAKNQVLENMRKSITEREGEKLKSALADLRELIDGYGEEEISELETEIQDKAKRRKSREQQIESINHVLQELNTDYQTKEKLKEEIDGKELMKNKFYKMMYETKYNWKLDIKEYIVRGGYFKEKHNIKYLVDGEKKLLGYLRAYAATVVESFIRNIQSNDIETSIPINRYLEYADSIILSYEYIIYPPKGGLFSKKIYVDIEDIVRYCSEIQQKVSDLLNEIVILCIKTIDDFLYDKQKEFDRIRELERRQNQSVRRYKEDIAKLEKEIHSLELEIEKIESQKQQDRDSLSMYLKYAEEAYLAQRNNIIEKINTMCSAEDKLLLILFLGILDKDYVKVTGGINEITK